MRLTNVHDVSMYSKNTSTWLMVGKSTAAQFMRPIIRVMYTYSDPIRPCTANRTVGGYALWVGIFALVILDRGKPRGVRRRAYSIVTSSRVIIRIYSVPIDADIPHYEIRLSARARGRIFSIDGGGTYVYR